jgi:hypothetical protein
LNGWEDTRNGQAEAPTADEKMEKNPSTIKLIGADGDGKEKGEKELGWPRRKSKEEKRERKLRTDGGGGEEARWWDGCCWLSATATHTHP